MEFCAANGRLQPGFRFHPTDVELVMYYLKRKVLGKRLEPEVVAEVDIYLFHPKDLRELACLKKDLYWYFFCPRGKKYGTGDRTKRATDTGYWKATGNDRFVSYDERTVGKIKTLVFHQGKPPKGERTNWVMHEYKLDDKKLADAGVCQDSYVLCKILKKSGLGPKIGEQYGALFIEEEWDDNVAIPNCARMVPVDVQDQSASVVTNVTLSVNECPTSTSEQAYSGAASMLAMDQPPSPKSNAAANIATSSKGLISNYGDAVDQVLAPMSIAASWLSCSKDPLPNYYDPVVQASTPMPKTAYIASTSTGPVLDYDNDEISRMLDDFTTDDLRNMYGSLEDLNHWTIQASEYMLENFCEGGLDLTDLDAPL